MRSCVHMLIWILQLCRRSGRSWKKLGRLIVIQPQDSTDAFNRIQPHSTVFNQPRIYSFTHSLTRSLASDPLQAICPRDSTPPEKRSEEIRRDHSVILSLSCRLLPLHNETKRIENKLFFTSLSPALYRFLSTCPVLPLLPPPAPLYLSLFLFRLGSSAGSWLQPWLPMSRPVVCSAENAENSRRARSNTSAALSFAVSILLLPTIHDTAPTRRLLSPSPAIGARRCRDLVSGRLPDQSRPAPSPNQHCCTRTGQPFQRAGSRLHGQG